MKKLFILALLAVATVSCNKTEIEVPAGEERTITISASLPNDTDSRMTYESDGKTPHGIRLKWETDDKLKLCFRYNTNYYHVEAPIEAGSISGDGRLAKFTIALPTEIPANAKFDCYIVYQRENLWKENNGGYFLPGTATYMLEDNEIQGVTLDKSGPNGSGKMRPVLYHRLKNVDMSALGNLPLEHMGWIMALHLKNNTTAEIKMPPSIELTYNGPDENSKIYNGKDYEGVDFNMETLEIVNRKGNTGWYVAGIVYLISQYDWLPYYKKTLAAGESITYYRWVVSTPLVKPMRAESGFNNKTVRTPDYTQEKSGVTKAKVYHLYLQYNGGTSLTWGR